MTKSKSKRLPLFVVKPVHPVVLFSLLLCVFHFHVNNGVSKSLLSDGKQSFLFFPFSLKVDACKPKVIVKPVTKAITGSPKSSLSATEALGSTKVIGNGGNNIVARTGTKMYSLAQQVPIVHHIMKSIGNRLDNFITQSHPAVAKTREFAKQIRDMMTKNGIEEEGIEGFNSVARNMRSMKSERSIAPLFSSTRNDIIEDIATIFEKMAMGRKVNRILGGVDSLEDISQKMGIEIMESVSRLSSIERKLGANFLMKSVIKSDGTQVLVP